jgi:hypothetical protein
MDVSSKAIRPLASVALTVLGLVGAHGCASVFGVDSDRYLVTRDAGGLREGGPSLADAGVDAAILVAVEAGPWDCLGLPVKPVDPATKVDLHVLLFDPLQTSTAAGSVDGGSDLVTVDYTPLVAVSLRSCALKDLSCSTPSPEVLTDDAGLAEFHVAGDFVGFFEIARSDLIPATFYPGSLLSGDTAPTFPTYDFTPDGLDLLASTVTNKSISLDPDGGLGHAFVTMYDCHDHQAPGVSLSIDNSSPETVTFYSVGGLPTTKTKQTDAFGLAGAVNVPVGSLAATATLVATGATLGTINITIRPGAITFAWVRVRTL